MSERKRKREKIHWQVWFLNMNAVIQAIIQGTQCTLGLLLPSTQARKNPQFFVNHFIDPVLSQHILYSNLIEPKNRRGGFPLPQDASTWQLPWNIRACCSAYGSMRMKVEQPNGAKSWSDVVSHASKTYSKMSSHNLARAGRDRDVCKST